jgi:hypothetical protein
MAVLALVHRVETRAKSSIYSDHFRKKADVARMDSGMLPKLLPPHGAIKECVQPGVAKSR